MAYKIKRKVHSAKWDRCILKVRRKQRGVNEYAVCTKSLGEKSYRK